MLQKPTFHETYLTYNIYKLFYKRTCNGYHPVSEGQPYDLVTYFLQEPHGTEVEHDTLDACKDYILAYVNRHGENSTV